MAKQQFNLSFLKAVAKEFLGDKAIISGIERYGKGAINDSFRVVSGGCSYLLQRINGNYFPEPLKLMDNFRIISVCQPDGLKAIAAANDLWHLDKNGSYWRMYRFFDHSYSCQKIADTYQAYEIARAYGKYLASLSQLPMGSLNVVVPSFHDTDVRYSQLVTAELLDEFGCATSCQSEINFVKSKASEIEDFRALLSNGSIPVRLTHNDTGIDNVLLDKRTGAAVAVIDWDTTMPGYSLWDFGDMFRSALGVEFDDPIGSAQCFDALLRGYLAGTGKLLLTEEIINFPLAGRIISLELGIRYLTDYLSGDKVFGYSDGASLLRARKSFLRYRMMEAVDDKIKGIVDKLLAVYVS